MCDVTTQRLEMITKNLKNKKNQKFFAVRRPCVTGQHINSVCSPRSNLPFALSISITTHSYIDSGFRVKLCKFAAKSISAEATHPKRHRQKWSKHAHEYMAAQILMLLAYCMTFYQRLACFYMKCMRFRVNPDNKYLHRFWSKEFIKKKKNMVQKV